MKRKDDPRCYTRAPLLRGMVLGGRDGTDGVAQGPVHRDGEESEGQRAPRLHGAHGTGTGAGRPAARRARTGLEPRDDPQGSARVGERLRHRRRLRLRGRKRAEARRQALLADITAIVDGQRQADPQLRTTRRSTRLTAAEVRRQLIAQQGDTDEALPTVQTIGAKLHARGYTLRAVAKTPP